LHDQLPSYVALCYVFQHSQYNLRFCDRSWSLHTDYTGMFHGIWMHENPAWGALDAREKTGAHDVAQVNPLKSLHIILGF
ncbi:MAG: hypothetical protein M0R76_06155, partial [Proteobacteria bacterium]|nr:hypothetical protein [Pseudomonadota bacterium]